jgi:hypothetical protein
MRAENVVRWERGGRREEGGGRREEGGGRREEGVGRREEGGGRRGKKEKVFKHYILQIQTAFLNAFI